MGIKIEKGRTYTYEEIKDIFELAKLETIREPLRKDIYEEINKGNKITSEELLRFKFLMSIESIIMFDTLEDNLFEKVGGK